MITFDNFFHSLFPKNRKSTHILQSNFHKNVLTFCQDKENSKKKFIYIYKTKDMTLGNQNIILLV